MKKTIFLIRLLTIVILVMHPILLKAQEVSYVPTLESIEQHPTPNWFQEARVGVFIHYSPGWFDMAMPDKFSADKWIDLFEKAGAEYFVFTTKHNNGWCSWPSNISEHSATQKNGPRDLVTPLVESARKADMKVGLYYNLMDGYEGVTTKMASNPELEPSEEYVMDFMFPLMQELVSTYQPDLLWTDGDWISTSDYWHSTEMVSWLYNWAEKEHREICLTDRWGKDIRICTTKETPRMIGDFWTLERRIMKDIVSTHPWESCITMTDNWGFSDHEEFRIPVGELIGVMCDIVSKGGKFLINIGPAPDGSIIKAERETLLGIGKWLEVNGEAIYGTKPMESTQENISDNKLDRAKDLLLPKTGINDFENVWKNMLVWNHDQGPIRYTVKEPYVYAIHQGWPGKELELNNLEIKPGSEIKMLGVKEPLVWKTESNSIIIKLPSEKPCEHAFVLKMELD